MSKSQFTFGKKGTTGYLCSILKDILVAIGKDATLYAMHSFRYGGAIHKLNHSIYRYTLDEIRYVAGWTLKDGDDTLATYLLKHLSKEREVENARVMLTCREGTSVKATLIYHTSMIKQIADQLSSIEAKLEQKRVQVVYRSKEEEIVELKARIALLEAHVPLLEV